MVHTVAYILDGTLVLTVYNDPSKLKQRVPGTTGNQWPRCPDDHQIRQPIASLAFDSFGSHLLLNLAASTSAVGARICSTTLPSQLCLSLVVPESNCLCSVLSIFPLIKTSRYGPSSPGPRIIHRRCSFNGSTVGDGIWLGRNIQHHCYGTGTGTGTSTLSAQSSPPTYTFLELNHPRLGQCRPLRSPEMAHSPPSFIPTTKHQTMI